MTKYDFELDLDSENSLSIMINAIKKNSRILEFGCANGRMTKYLNDYMDCKVDIVEIDEEAGKEASKYAQKSFLGKVNGDIEKFIWKEKNDGKYDYMIFADVLEHLNDPQKVLEKCQTLLNEQGSILISIPNVAHNAILIDLINDEFRYNSIGLLDNTHITLFSYHSLKRMVENSGFITVLEKATYCNVGETEFNNNYEFVNKNMAKELKNRDKGDIYQFVFEVKKKSYVESNDVQRIVDFKKKYKYNIECYIQEQYDEEFSESKSILKSLSISPNNHVEFQFDQYNHIKFIRIDPINTNCVIKINDIYGKIDNERIEVNIIGSNGTKVNDSYYIFSHEDPQLYIQLKNEIDSVVCDFSFLDYDSKDISVYDKIILKEKCATEEILKQRNVQLEEKEKQISDMSEILEKKNKELQENNININKMQEILEDKDKKIEEKNKEIEQTNNELQEKNKELEKKDEEINELIFNPFLALKKKFFKKHNK
ncbi:MAG: methyltransferase domain-containing protein [Clostridium butyricum]|nr:methyltransferase domain-containing protein [Clostridium butyricum]